MDQVHVKLHESGPASGPHCPRASQGLLTCVLGWLTITNSSKLVQHGALHWHVHRALSAWPAQLVRNLTVGRQPAAPLPTFLQYSIAHRIRIVRRDARFVKNLVAGVTRWRRRLDFILDELTGGRVSQVGMSPQSGGVSFSRSHG